MSLDIVIDLKQLYTEISGETAKLADLQDYVAKAQELAGEGNTVVLTGGAPIWMYLKIAHALHGKVRRLLYTAPGQGIIDLEIFSHDPF
jgi:hypothetical protein